MKRSSSSIYSMLFAAFREGRTEASDLQAELFRALKLENVLEDHIMRDFIMEKFIDIA